MISEIDELVGDIPGFDEEAARRARARWDSLGKPLGSLGLLEDTIVRIAGLTGDPDYTIDKRALIVCCADNGVTRQGVSQVDASITGVLARALAEDNICTCKMARLAKVDVITTSAAQVSENVSALTGLYAATIGRPLVKVAAFSYGVRKAFARASGRSSGGAA